LTVFAADISRAEKNHIKLENVDFKALDAIEPVIVLIAQTLRYKNQELDLISFINPNIPKLRGDLVRFKQIILNLISNNLSSNGAIYIRYKKSY
jgi:signal transduction histidine kinase